jgi:hypothetical protein
LICDQTTSLPATLTAQTYAAGGVAYVCRGTKCLPPIDDPAALPQVLRDSSV